MTPIQARAPEPAVGFSRGRRAWKDWRLRAVGAMAERAAGTTRESWRSCQAASRVGQVSVISAPGIVAPKGQFCANLKYSIGWDRPT
jgi:hypothetical protein